jgi:predicted SAM-dependent methyltransferase
VRRLVAGRLPAVVRRVLGFGSAAGHGGEEPLRVRPGLELVGVDVVSRRVEEAKPVGNADVVYASGTDLPLLDGALDAVVAAEFLEHLEPADVDRRLSEARRVLRLGSMVAITTPNSRRPCTYYKGRHTLGRSHLSAHTVGSLAAHLRRLWFIAVAVAGS